MCAIEYYTYDDYKRWEGDWELINGIPLAMAPSPVKKHQIIANRIAFDLTKSTEECTECDVVYELDYIVSEDTVLKPDIALICDEENDYITKAPKIVVEVISPATARRDEKHKFEIYEREKVHYYVLVYPDKLFAKVYRLIDGKYDKVGDFSGEKYLFAESECQAEIDFGAVFAKYRKG